MRRTTAVRAVTIAALGYAASLRHLKPRPSDLLNPQWHREAPVRLVLLGLTRLMPWLYRRYGEAGVRALQFVFYQVGVDRAPVLARELSIDPNDARSLGRVLDYEDGLVGVRGLWTEETRGRAVKEERYCPGAPELAACPEVCSCLMMAMEAGTFSVINPDLKVPELTKLLSKGDDCCLAVIEVPGGGAPASETSPRATPGEFPPRIHVPGLRARLAALGLLSVMKAAVTLARSGPDQPMYWYESFRYRQEDVPACNR